MTWVRLSLFPLGNIIGIPAASQQNIPEREHSPSTGRYLADYSRAGIDVAGFRVPMDEDVSKCDELTVVTGR